MDREICSQGKSPPGFCPRRTACLHDERNQNGLMMFASDMRNSGAIDSGKPSDGEFHIAQFDAVTANLDATILAAAVFEQTVGINPPPVSGPQHPGPITIEVC